MVPIKVKEFIFTLNDFKTLGNTITNSLEYVFQKKILFSLPQIVDIVITKKCNLACIFCKKYESGSTSMSLEEFEMVSKQVLPFARKLNICSGGEPFCHSGIIDILKIAKKHKVWVSVVTNGMLLNSNMITEIVQKNLIHSIAFSVDGIKKRTVENLRRNARLPEIIANIELIIQNKMKYYKNIPNISIRYALMRENIEELPEAVAFWGSLKVPKITCNFLSMHDGINKEQSLFFHRDLTEKFFVEALKTKKYFPNLSLSLPPLYNLQSLNLKNNLSKKCAYPWMFAMIDVDGRVFPDYNSWGVIEMGKLIGNGEKFNKIWNNLKYYNLRRTVNNDKVTKAFSYCSVCPIRLGAGSKSLHFGDEIFFENLNSEEKKEFLKNTKRKKI